MGIGWMLKGRNDLDKPSRDILTRFALSLVVEFGHKSCKKAKRIQHEMDKKEKEDEETTKGDNDEMDVDEHKDGLKMNWEDNESVESFESDADDVIIWQPQWVVLLNEFSNDSNPVIRITTRKIKTVFMDWEEH